MPHSLRVLCDEALVTIDRVLFDGNYNGPRTAHPKIHPENGNLCRVSCSLEDRSPPASVQVIDRNGNLLRVIHIKNGIRRKPMIHDTAIMRRYVIVMDLPLLLRSDAMVRDNYLPIVFDKQAGSRFGLPHVDAVDGTQIHRFAPPLLFIFRKIAAYDEGNTVVLWACHTQQMELSLDRGRVASPEESPTICKIVFDVATGKANRQTFVYTTGWELGSLPSALGQFVLARVQQNLHGRGTQLCLLNQYFTKISTHVHAEVLNSREQES